MLPNRPPYWVGREQEFAVLRAAAESLGRGEGTVVWVEGEPGIGKSALVAEALAVADQPGWDVGWGGADQLTRLPLRVMRDCLQVRSDSPDPRRAHAANLMHGRLSEGDASANGIEMLLTLADELCAAAPTVLAVDDLQWADEASLAVWHELATSISQLRLRLIGTSRPAPYRPEVQQVRMAVVRGGGRVLRLGPLAEPDVTALVTAMVGAVPGEGLRRLAAHAAGNPLYLRELVDALMREQAVEVRPVADIVARPGCYSVTDLSVVLRRPVVDLAAGLREAAGAGIVDGAGAVLAFRHALIRESLYQSMPEALRTALHAEAARELAASGADVLGVAQQLLSAGRPGAGWSRDWLVQAAPALAWQAPQLAVELQRRELEETPVGDKAWDALIVGLVRALLNVGGYEEAIAQASRALAVMTDPAWRGEMSWMLAHAQVSGGHSYEAVITTMRQALAASDLPLPWQARLLALLAMYARETNGFDVSRTLAYQALTAAEDAGDLSARAQALFAVWIIHSIARDHATALECIDRTLLIIGYDPSYDDLHRERFESKYWTTPGPSAKTSVEGVPIQILLSLRTFNA